MMLLYCWSISVMISFSVLERKKNPEWTERQNLDSKWSVTHLDDEMFIKNKKDKLHITWRIIWYIAMMNATVSQYIDSLNGVALLFTVWLHMRFYVNECVVRCFPDWLRSYTNLTERVSEIFKVVCYFPDI